MRWSVSAVLGSFSFFLATVAAPGSLEAQATLRIYHIDVDQGDATLFVSPTGETLLVDSGRNGHGARIRRVLQRAGVTRIDHFVTTHYHEDHYGGVDELTQSPAIPILNAHDRGDKAHLPASKLNSTRFTEYQNAVGSSAHHLQRGESFALGPEVRVTCVASGGVVLGETNPAHGHDENDMSVALLVTYRDFRYFVGGDIEASTEQKIADLEAVLDVDMYQANHHGSHTSSSPDFIRNLAPTVVVISNGDRADFQHPRQVTLNNLSGLSTAPSVFQINRYTKGGAGGNEPNTRIADLDPPGDEGTILVEVDPDAGSYELSFGTTFRTFTIKPRGPGPVAVVIESLLPNPVGADRELEEVTVHNAGGSAVSMQGWSLRDLAQRVWPLDGLGTIAPGASAVTVRAGFPLNLNNNGDTIVLVDPAGQVRDRLGYTASREGVRIQRIP